MDFWDLFLFSFSYHLGQKVLRILHFLTPKVKVVKVVWSESEMIQPDFNIVFWGEGGVFVVVSAFKNFILKLDMGSLSCLWRWRDTGCHNVHHCQHQSYSGLHIPSYSTYLWNNSWVQTFHCFKIILLPGYKGI